jgi:ribosome maturation factor RimP
MDLIAHGAARALYDLMRPAAEEAGFALLRVTLGGAQASSKSNTLQIMAEHIDGREINVGECATLSRALSVLLDEKDPVAGEYMLEVSSPGIDRPLTRLQDFQRWAGFEARLETAEAINGQKRFHGAIAGVDGNEILLKTEQETIRLPYPALSRAKLVLNDHLLTATRKVA